MVSVWWVVAAFVAGGYSGILLMALMTMAQSTAEETELPGCTPGGIAPRSSTSP
jgi:hypothetical protein